MKPNKLFILSSVALGMFAVSTANVQAQMHRAGGPGSRPMSRAMAGRHFGDRDHDFDGRFRRFNNFAFFGFGFPGYYPYGYYGYPYPYYGYPYGYYAPGDYPPPAYQGYMGPGYQGQGSGDVSLVLQLQRRLAREGYYHGAIDGVIGSGTRRAIREERANGLPADTRGLRPDGT